MKLQLGQSVAKPMKYRFHQSYWWTLSTDGLSGRMENPSMDSLCGCIQLMLAPSWWRGRGRA